MRTLLFIVGAVVVAGLVALGIRKFLEATMTIRDRGEGTADDHE